MKVKLREYQNQVIEKIRASYRRGCKAPLLQSPTGSGKTVIFSAITEGAAVKGKRVMILVHRRELVIQCSDALDSIGVSHGLIASGKTMSNEPVQVASVQTLVRRIGNITSPDLIIVDEGHHVAAGSWKKVIDAFPKARLLMVTATPCRLDGKGLGVNAGGFADDLIHGPTVKFLIRNGFLAKFKVFAPILVDPSGVKIRFGDYSKSHIDLLFDRKIFGNAVEHYSRICPGAPAIAFCSSVKSAEMLAEKFNEHGIPSASLDGKMDSRKRDYLIRSLGNGGIKVLTSCDIISEGTDIPVVTAAILLRPTQSLSLYLQQVGRCLRPHPDKEFSIIIDHVGNVIKHGFPDEPRHWSLDATIKPKKKKKYPEDLGLRQCPKCFFMVKVTERVCPNCKSRLKPSIRMLKEIDAQMEQLNRQDIAKKARAEIGKARTLEELEEIAKKRGYHRKWAWHVFNSRKNRRKKEW